MKLFQWVSFTCIFSIVFWVVKAYAPTVKTIYPTQCAFLIDDQLAQNLQLSLKEYVINHYQQYKDPDYIVQNLSKQFPEVQNVDAFICKSGSLCFACDALRPLFQVDGQFLIGENQQVVQAAHYKKDLVDELYNIEVQQGQYEEGLVKFFKTLSPDLLKNFSMKWITEYEIELRPKKGSELLIFSADNSSVDEDIKLFDYVKNNVLSKSRLKKSVYDFRFKEQVVVR